jgi:hypothetical protein
MVRVLSDERRADHRRDAVGGGDLGDVEAARGREVVVPLTPKAP